MSTGAQLGQYILQTHNLKNLKIQRVWTPYLLVWVRQWPALIAKHHSRGIRSAALALVTAQMFFQMRRARKALLADGAVERPLASVRPHMLLHFAARSKLVVAHDTSVSLVARVRDHVTPQHRPVAERLCTHVADVRPIARMHSHVLLQKTFQCESLATHLARERTLAYSTNRIRWRNHLTSTTKSVICQQMWPCVLLPTHLTDWQTSNCYKGSSNN